jgi:hypothetical protein
LCRVGLVVAFVLGPRPAASQNFDRRPSPAEQIRNDWEAYYNAGISLLDRDSRRAEARRKWQELTSAPSR